jgi:hypothetical protein
LDHAGDEEKGAKVAFLERKFELEEVGEPRARMELIGMRC